MADALATKFLLLFDGVDEQTIARTLVEAMGLERAEKLSFFLEDYTGVSFPAVVCPADVLQEIDSKNEDYEYEGESLRYEYVGTREQLVQFCNNYSWDDLGDMSVGACDEVIDKLTDAGLIVKRTVTSEGNDAA